MCKNRLKDKKFQFWKILVLFTIKISFTYFINLQVDWWCFISSLKALSKRNQMNLLGKWFSSESEMNLVELVFKAVIYFV